MEEKEREDKLRKRTWNGPYTSSMGLGSLATCPVGICGGPFLELRLLGAEAFFLAFGALAGGAASGAAGAAGTAIEGALLLRRTGAAPCSFRRGAALIIWPAGSADNVSSQ